MKKYKVYLSKAHEVVDLLAKAHQVNHDNVIEISRGPVEMHKDVIPAIYHNRGLYYCAVARESEGAESYEIIFA